MPQRLPQVNADDGQWGSILNQFLEKEHFNDGGDNAANGGHKTITIRPGTTAAGSAPLKFNSGALMTTPEVGAVEFASNRLYYTQTTGPTRLTVLAVNDASGANGDLYYRNGSGDLVRLPAGSNGQTLTVTGGVPTWSTPSSSGLAATGTSRITVGGTAPSSPSVGDLWVDTN